MIKLMKYELRKQAFSKLIILILLGLGEIVFLYGALFMKSTPLGIGIAVLTMLTYGALFFTAFESVFTYSNDLKTKTSYMLFLTPKSSYQIIGAKIIIAGIQVLLVGSVFLLVGIGDIMLLVARYDAIAELKQMIVELVKIVTKADLNDTKLIIYSFIVLLLGWIKIITIAFFSITLSTTLLANKKYKGLISLAIFIGINMVFSLISNKLFQMKFHDTYLIQQSLYILCIIVLTYVGTAWLIDKKVCV